MTPAQVRAARISLGMTQDQLAAALRMGGDGKRAIRRWEAGEREISGPASVAIEALLTGWRPS
jgi:DNA-binding transcriptional regulator YiaG